MKRGRVKGLARLAGLAELAAAIVGVGGAAVSAKEVAITYWGSWPGATYGPIEKAVVERFNKEYAGRIKVRAMDIGPGFAIDDKILTAIAAGAAPDLFKLDRFEVGSFAARGTLQQLDPYVKRDKVDKNLFYKPTWNENVYDGKLFGLPWNTDCRALYYNRDMFRQLGLDPDQPPKSWEDTMLVSKKMDLVVEGKLTRAGLKPQTGNWYYLGWLYSAGGDITDAAGKKITWNSIAGLKALQFMRDAIDKYKGLTPGSGDFMGGKTGMTMEGSFLLGEAKKNRKFEWGAASPPRPTGLENDKVSWAGGFSLCIPLGSKHPQEAWEFIKYWATNKDAQLLIGTTGQMPALKAAGNDEKFRKSDPLIAVFADLLDDSKYRTVLPCGKELWALYTDKVMAELLKGERGPSVILDVTASEGQKVLDRAWARIRGK